MKELAEALFTVEGTRARTAKVLALATALASVASRDPARLPFVARFITGTLLPTADDRTLGVGGTLVFDAACLVTKAVPSELGAMIGLRGDLGTAVGEAIAKRRERERDAGDPEDEAPSLSVERAERLVHDLVDQPSRAEKQSALVAALEACSPLEARYLVRALLGEMRIGAKEGIVEDAIAKAFGRPLAEVRTAAGLVTDVGDLAELARTGRLGEAEVLVGRPVGFMLATPIETARGADLSVPHAIEDKIDGIRAQLHLSSEGARLYARGKGSVSIAFPDVTGPLERAMQTGTIPRAIVDGELVVVSADGKLRPFSAIQPRLKKTAPDDALLRDHPVRYLAYDLLYEGETSLLDLPFSERRQRLVLFGASAPSPFVVHATRPLVVPPAPPARAREGSREGSVETAREEAAETVAAALPAGQKSLRRKSGATGEAALSQAAASAVLDAEFDEARARGAEGLVLKRLDAPYAAGVRGFAWLKVKKALATLDVVVVGAEYGHGKRAGVLSDYTFSILDGGELKTIGKAYNGLTDVEIASLTSRLLELAAAPHDTPTRQRHGYLPVRPEIVLEIAFDGLQRSDRHSSGFALRFPRITRIRDDKKPEDADTLEAVRALWASQLESGHREDLVAKDRKPVKAKGGRKSGRRPDVRQKTKQLRLFEDD